MAELASGVEGGVRRAPGRLRSTRGAPADLARGSGGAGTWWSVVAAAAQSGCAAEQLGRGALGLGVAALGGWVQGVSVGLKGAPGISGGRAQEGNRRGLGRGSRLPLRARGEGKGMTLLSGSGRSVRRGGRSVGARRAGAYVGAGRWQVGSGAKGGGRRSRERAERGLGPRGEERGGELGRPGEREREEEADRAGLGSGPRGRKKKKNGPSCFGFGFLSISFSFLFLIQTKFEFKSKFEFKPHSNN